MATPVIMDLIAAASLAFFTIWGIRRGLFRSLAGLVIVIVSLVGAGMIASTFTAPVTKLVSPLVERCVEYRVENLTTPQSPQVEMPEAEVESELSLDQILERLGLGKDFTQSLAREAGQRIQETGVSIATAVVQSLAQSVIHAVLYILSFLLLSLLLHILVGAMDLVLKLPGLHLLNTLGGAAFGLLEGAVLLFLALCLAQKLGLPVAKLAEDTILLEFYMTHVPAGVVSFLQ